VLSALNALAGIVVIHHKHRRFLCALNVIFNLFQLKIEFYPIFYSILKYNDNLSIL
jgi:hypothetical protein